MPRIAIFEGYGVPSFAGGTHMARRKRRSGGGGAQRNRMRKAAKACKGRKGASFRACMRKKLRKGGR